MNIEIQCDSKKLNGHTDGPSNSGLCVLLLSGGGIKLGKERYFETQRQLAHKGITSVSFDFSGINGSGVLLQETSLKTRIQETVCVMRWMQRQYPSSELALYGASMGGYIALGALRLFPGVFKKLILHAPAAYTPSVYAINFGTEFTSEIHRERSWADSDSFVWLEEYTHPVLLIKAENDDVIPNEVISRYENASQSNPDFKSVLLENAPHNIWGSPEGASFRERADKLIISFLES